MTALAALVAVLGLAAVGTLGGLVPGLRAVFAIGVPYAAAAAFLVGVTVRVLRWAAAPVPFRIPTTCGQQRSLGWIPSARLDNPSSALGALGRVALEVFLFRSLFRNTHAELHEGPRFSFGEDKTLWVAALAFHWSLLVIGLRHLRLFVEPVPILVTALERTDGFFEIATPALYLTDIAVVAALGYVAWRRLAQARVRYISIFEDYAAVFLLLAVIVSGILMRYLYRVDTLAAKQLALGLAVFRPVVPAEVGALFFAHLFLASALFAWFPSSKLVHMAGAMLSPTRNLANTNRLRRHVNPWDSPLPVHTYAEWEDEVRDELRIAGLPMEKE